MACNLAQAEALVQVEPGARQQGSVASSWVYPTPTNPPHAHPARGGGAAGISPSFPQTWGPCMSVPNKQQKAPALRNTPGQSINDSSTGMRMVMDLVANQFAPADGEQEVVWASAWPPTASEPFGRNGARNSKTHTLSVMYLDHLRLPPIC